ncbi:hypothetical protein GVX82_02530 [Patescibacteria group bacterium]|jgi:hypothetical protein|nr:hypothetical protein [Patescibacteria group bacterium]
MQITRAFGQAERATDHKILAYLTNGTSIPDAAITILVAHGMVVPEDITEEVCRNPPRLHEWITHLELLKAFRVDLPGAATLLDALVPRRDLRIADVVTRAVSFTPTERDPFGADDYLALFRAIANATLFIDELTITHPRTLVGLVEDARAAARHQRHARSQAA